MQKPLAFANDLADHDDIEDDCDLVFGPHPSKYLSYGSPMLAPGRQLGNASSFRGDTSILRNAPIAAKLAQASSAPAPHSVLSRTSTPDGHIYANGNPVISTAPASRPTSGSVRMPRMSAPSGGGPATNEVGTAPTSKSVHGGRPSGHESLTARPDSGEARTQGGVQDGDRDTSVRPRSGLLRRLSSLTFAPRPSSAKHDAAAAADCAKAARGAEDQGCRAAAGPCTVVTSSALPCVDVEPERRQLLRKLSLQDGPGLLGSRGRPHSCERRATMDPPESYGQAAGTYGSAPYRPPEAAAPALSSAAIAAASPPPERPSTPLRRLSRMLSNALVASGTSNALVAPGTSNALVAPGTSAVSDQQDQDGAGASKRRTSLSGVRELFSRPSSAKRKSEAGWCSQQQQQSQPVEAWKQTTAPQQQQQQATTRRSLDVCSDDGPEGDRVQEFGSGAVVVRHASGVFKRAANALAAAMAR